MERVTDYQIEAWLRGELDADRRAAVERAIAADPALAARVEALRSEDAAFLAAHPPDWFVAAVLDRNRAAARRRWVGGLTVVALAASALLGMRLLAADAPIGPVPLEPPEQIRVKGPSLRVFTRVGDRAEPLRDGSTVPAGSTVQLVLLEGGVQGAVFSVDGRGAVTRHFPTTGDGSAELPAGPLPTAFTLDMVADFERFFLVTGESAFGLAPVQDALAALDGDPDREPTLPPGLTAHPTLLRKVTP